jgi:hypothetical protein
MPGQRKPDGLRQRGNRTPSLRLSGENVERIIPPMPSPGGGRRWLQSTHETWEFLFSSELADIIQPLDGALLKHWITCIEERDRAMSLFREQRFVSGSRGQTRLTPAWKLVQDLSVEIRQAEAQLGIGGLNRFKLGLTMGQAAAALNSSYGDYDDVETVTVDEPGMIDVQAVAR